MNSTRPCFACSPRSGSSTQSARRPSCGVARLLVSKDTTDGGASKVDESGWTVEENNKWVAVRVLMARGAIRRSQKRLELRRHAPAHSRTVKWNVRLPLKSRHAKGRYRCLLSARSGHCGDPIELVRLVPRTDIDVSSVPLSCAGRSSCTSSPLILRMTSTENESPTNGPGSHSNYPSVATRVC